MASITKRGSGYIVEVYIDRQQRKIYGFKNKRDAQRAGDKIESLKAAKRTGEVSPDLAIWIKRLAEADSAIYGKLAEFGLVEPLPEKTTLRQLFERFHASQHGVSKETRVTYLKPQANLIEYFGEDCELEKITPRRADEFEVWLQKTPLNRRKKGEATPYSTATVNRRIRQVKQFFHYAKRVGMVADNLFQYVKGGESVNPEKWCYVDASTVEKVIDASALPKWRAIVALGRFAGTRGSSELYNMTWDDIHFSSENDPGQIVIKAEKNKRHGRKFRTVPMHPVVERELSTLFEQSREKEPHVFPGMKKQTNFCTMTQKLVSAAGIPLWQNTWYNLRKSFCCDLMEAGVDPVVYEAITDHSYAVALKHYQIPHATRLQHGYDQILKSWQQAVTPPSPPEKPLPDVGVKKGVTGGLKGGLNCIAYSNELLRHDSQVLYLWRSEQEKENACTIMQAFDLGVTGFEPVASTV